MRYDELPKNHVERKVGEIVRKGDLFQSANYRYGKYQTCGDSVGHRVGDGWYDDFKFFRRVRNGKKKQKNLWNNDLVQFARLIAELENAGTFTPKIIKKVCDETDLTVTQLFNIVDNACATFDESKHSI